MLIKSPTDIVDAIHNQAVERLGLSEVRGVSDIVTTGDTYVDMALNGERHEASLKKGIGDPTQGEVERSELINAAIRAKSQAKTYISSALPVTHSSPDHRKIALAHLARAAKLFLLAKSETQFINIVHEMVRFSNKVTMALGSYRSTLSAPANSHGIALAAVKPVDEAV